MSLAVQMEGWNDQPLQRGKSICSAHPPQPMPVFICVHSFLFLHESIISENVGTPSCIAIMYVGDYFPSKSESRNICCFSEARTAVAQKGPRSSPHIISLGSEEQNSMYQSEAAKRAHVKHPHLEYLWCKAGVLPRHCSFSQNWGMENAHER